MTVFRVYCTVLYISSWMVTLIVVAAAALPTANDAAAAPARGGRVNHTLIMLPTAHRNPANAIYCFLAHK